MQPNNNSKHLSKAEIFTHLGLLSRQRCQWALFPLYTWRNWGSILQRKTWARVRINPGDSLYTSSLWVCYKNIIYELCGMMIAPRPPIQSRNSTCVVAPFIFHWPEVALSSSWKGEKSLPLTISRATYWKQNVWELLLLALVRSASFSQALSLFPEDFLLLCLDISKQTWACHVSQKSCLRPKRLF